MCNTGIYEWRYPDGDLRLKEAFPAKTLAGKFVDDVTVARISGVPEALSVAVTRSS
jgi:hypothetical protein